MIDYKKWEDYFSNKLSNVERYELEKQSLESEGETDAFDFYAVNGFDPYKEIIKELNNKILLKESKKNVSKLSMLLNNRWVAAAVIFGLLIGIYCLYDFSKNNSVKNAYSVKKVIQAIGSNYCRNWVIANNDLNEDSLNKLAVNSDTIVVQLNKNYQFQKYDALLANAIQPINNKLEKNLNKFPNVYIIKIKTSETERLKELYILVGKTENSVKVTANKWVEIRSDEKSTIVTLYQNHYKTNTFQVVAGKQTVISIEKL